MPLVPSLVFLPPIRVEKLGTSFTEAPKCITVALRSPTPPPHTADFRISSLAARSQSRQNLCSPAILAARPTKGQPAIPIRLQTIRNSKHPIHLHQFPSVSQTDERFFLPAFKKFQNGTAANATLKSLDLNGWKINRSLGQMEWI
ncbi:hypothetical protein AVEN_29940-1 [Araneus ventricosus]|uniref:Uncharacterized protein n=1 Tax=Araneus ventricosus TaxID=182803 RepID=A0A4Y2LJD6_ARAVE|nr:hypothetical protein AVEN_29940-1 [Araneus ventricosus]